MAFEIAADQQCPGAAARPDTKTRPGSMRLAPVLSLALGLRALAAAFMFRNDPQAWFYNQASELSCLAHSLLTGQGLASPFGGTTGPSAFLAPGYPLLVAAVTYFFGGHSGGAAAVLVTLQIGFGVLITFLVMMLAERLFDRHVAYLAGGLCAASPTMMWLPTLFWETSLSTLLLMGALVLALRCKDRSARSAWMAVGLYCAFALLVNPALLITFAGLGAWTACHGRTIAIRGPLTAAATCFVLFSIWPIRNAIALHAFIPLRSNLGYELWQGNRPGSDGLFTPGLYLNSNQLEFERYRALGEVAYIHEKSVIAHKTIEADPFRFGRLSLRRVAIFWTALGGRGLSWVVIGEITITSAFAMSAIFLMLIQGRFGAGLLLIPFLFFPLPYYLTHPDFRFRLLLEPIAILMTSWILTDCYRRVNAAYQRKAHSI